MSQKVWNDLEPSAMKPIVAHGPQTVTVFAWTRRAWGMTPHVTLRVGEETDSQLMRLTPAEARRIAIAMLHAAEAVESTR